MIAREGMAWFAARVLISSSCMLVLFPGFMFRDTNPHTSLVLFPFAVSLLQTLSLSTVNQVAMSGKRREREREAGCMQTEAAFVSLTHTPAVNARTRQVKIAELSSSSASNR